MAIPTTSFIEKTVFGNKRLHVLSCTMGDASGNIVTGLGTIDYFSVSVISCATASFISKKNIGSGATSIPGTLNISVAASGDVFEIHAYGK